jgi:pimeloyl-ACP methyl ester carboxylesterase
MTRRHTNDGQQLSLSDGRRLGFAEYGDPAGSPLFYFHGWPSSRLEAQVIDAAAAQTRVRVIAPDRPGFGLSDFLPCRNMSHWPADVCALASHLGLSRFGVLGVSGGGPYAAACAALIPDHLSSVLMICSVAPCDMPHATDGMVRLNRWLLSFARKAPWLAQKVSKLCLWVLWRRGDQLTPKQIENRLPEPDKKAVADAGLRQALIAGSREALRRGVGGAAWDGLLLARPWGFDLQTIRVPVHLWHGEKDVIVPCAMGRYLAKVIPGCQARFSAEDGHFSLPYTRMKDILAPVFENPKSETRNSKQIQNY